MRTSGRYRPDHVSIGAFLMSRQLNRPVRQVAMRISAEARARHKKETGQTASSYRTYTALGTGPLGNPGHKWSGGPRRVTIVRNAAPGAAAQEFGFKTKSGKKVPGRHTLRRVGLKYHDPISEKLER